MVAHPALAFVGWFDAPDQTEPVYDPGIANGKAKCLLCTELLTRPVQTVSLMKAGSERSYFYRTHKSCYVNASSAAIAQCESTIIDTLPHDDSL